MNQDRIGIDSTHVGTNELRSLGTARKPPTPSLKSSRSQAVLPLKAGLKPKGEVVGKRDGIC